MNGYWVNLKEILIRGFYSLVGQKCINLVHSHEWVFVDFSWRDQSQVILLFILQFKCFNFFIKVRINKNVQVMFLA